MSRITRTKLIRQYFAKDGKTLPPLPQQYKPCPVCGERMCCADGSIVITHGGACRKEYRANKHLYESRT